MGTGTSVTVVGKKIKKDISLKYTVFRILDIDDLHRAALCCEVYRMQSCHGETSYEKSRLN